MKCEDCSRDWPESPAVHQARALMAVVDHYGNLHCEVSDGNLEDDWFRPSDEHGGLSPVRASVLENRAGATADESMAEVRLVALLESMTEDERFLAYRVCPDCMRESHDQMMRLHEARGMAESPGMPPEWSATVDLADRPGLDADAVVRPFGVVIRTLPSGIVITGED